MHRFLSIFVALWLLVANSVVSAAGTDLTFNCDTITQIPPTECQALVALYNSTNGPAWKNNTNWLVSTNPETWYGVYVSSGHVYQIYLSDNNLTGSLPSELGNLPALQYLIIESNPLAGSIPPEIGNLVNLKQLFLDYNQLTGSIPPELGKLVNVEQFYLRYNRLTGPIPDQLGDLTNVLGIDLSNNLLSGSIPSTLGKLGKIQYLMLPNNQLSGLIPPELGNLASLYYLILNDNHLTGSIPPQIGNMGNLYRLFLYNNALSGSIPPEIGGLSNLQLLYLQGNQLTGSIPPQLGSLPNLTGLVLVQNQLTGIIPPELGGLAKLRQLFLSNNQLSGPIPHEIGNLFNLSSLDLRSNQLEGDIPSELINIALLSTSSSWLKLDYNRLNIPANYPDPQNALHSLLSAKDPEWQLTQAFVQPVGANGGTVTALDGKTQLGIANGTLEGDVEITYIPQSYPNQAVGRLGFAFNSFQVEAQDTVGNPVTTFASPIVVTLNYTDDSINGMFEDSLKLYYWDTAAQQWQDAVSTCPGGTYTRDMVGNTLTVSICHFSEYALMGVKFPPVYLPLINR